MILQQNHKRRQTCKQHHLTFLFLTDTIHCHNFSGTLRAEMYLIIEVEIAQISRFCCSLLFHMCKCALSKHKISNQGREKTSNIHHLLHTPYVTKNLPNSQVFSNNRCTLFSCQFRNQKDIFRSGNLI